jgi:nucleotide-binding universal stress UspA family protein
MKQKMKILVAYDGSKCANAAWDDLRWAGLPPEVEAVVLSVADVWEPPAPPLNYDQVASEMDRQIRARAEELRQHVERAVEEARSLAVDAGRRVQTMFPAWQVRAEACFGTPAWELIKKADEWHPDLMVVGSQGRSAFGRVLLGSVSQKVLNEARCCVRIARKRARPDDSPVRVLVAVDGSPNAEAAVRAVAGRKWPRNAEIRLLAADDPFNRSGAGYADWDFGKMQPASGAEEQAWISKVIEHPAKVLRDAGLNVSQRTCWGDARHIILEEAEEWKADCVVMGARGLGRFHRFLLGSVSAAVAARAPCSVEVVRLQCATL